MKKVTTRSEELRTIENHINALPGPLRILEAGCGRKWPLNIAVPYTLAGIDLDEKALRARQQTLGDLDTEIIGDLCTTKLPEKFDVIYCSYVLEHVHGAQLALENFLGWLNPGRLMVLRIPDRRSVYGFLSNHTPHWLHVLCVRFLMGLKNAGKPGHGPYPVAYDPIVSVDGIIQWCATHGLTIRELRYLCTYRRKPLVKALMFLGSILSLGHLSWRHNNVTFVIRA